MIRPIHDRLLVRELPALMKQGALHLPLRPQGATTFLDCQVIAVGPGRPLDNGKVAKLAVTVGDTVTVRRHAGQAVTHEGDDVILVREIDVLGIVSQ